MKTILLLGGSRQQVPAIETAKQLGYRTVLIDYLLDNPGQYIADKWYNESTTDIEAVYRIAKEEKVDGILAYASDPAALPAAIVCERLGLPTNPASSVEILGVKHKFRQFLANNGFPCPKTYTFTPSTPIKEIEQGLENLKFPIVVKPTDSSGSKGVSFLENTEKLRKAISHADEYSRNKILIAEEFIERTYPNVIGGDIFIENGNIILYGDMECIRGNHGKSLIPIGERSPNGLSSNQKSELHKELQRLIDCLQIKFGELNIEVLIGAYDSIHFLEVGPRAGGNMIPIQLSDIYNINLLEANINAALGIPCQIRPIKSKEYFLTFVLHSTFEGEYAGYNLSLFAQRHLYREVIYKKYGDSVEQFDGAGKAIGILFFKFDNRTEMETLCKNYSSNISVNIISPIGGGVN